MPRQKSIQAETNTRGHKSRVAMLNDKTRKNASRNGMPWEGDEVDLLVGMIQQDSTTYEMAMSLSRTYYAAQIARQHIGFMLRHAEVLLPVLEEEVGK